MAYSGAALCPIPASYSRSQFTMAEAKETDQYYNRVQSALGVLDTFNSQNQQGSNPHNFKMDRYTTSQPSWSAGALYKGPKQYVNRRVMMKVPRGGESGTIAKYGLSYRDATPEQKSSRINDGFFGRGRYRRKRTFRPRYRFRRRSYLRYRGRGSYWSRLGHRMAHAGRSIGRGVKRGVHYLQSHADDIANVASIVAPEYAPEIQTAKQMLGRGMYSGRGSYEDDMEDGGNVLMQGGRPPIQVMQGSSDNQEILLSHTEYLQDIYGGNSAAFTNNKLALNPGILENFPFLAQLAANYEEYEFVQLLFHFKSTVDASISNTGTTGTLIMATNYNADAAAFKSKEAMMQYHGAHSTRLDKDMIHGVECEPSKNAGSAIKYIRTMPVPNGDLKDFDLGNFQWALVNLPSQFFNQQLGELWVTYTVKLAKPKLAVSLGRTIAEDRFISNGGESTTSILGTNLLKMAENNIGVKLTEVPGAAGEVGVKFIFPAFTTGRYEIIMFKQGDGSTSVLGNTTGNVTNVVDIWSNTNYSSFRHMGSAGSNSGYICHVDVAPATAGIDNTISIITSSVSPTQAIFYIRPYNPDIGIPATWVDDESGVTVVPS